MALVALAVLLLLVVIKVLMFGGHPFKTRRSNAPEEIYYNGTHYFGTTTILISLDGLRNDYLKRGVTPHLVNIGK